MHALSCRKNAFSCRKMHFPAENAVFGGAHGRKPQEIAGGLQGSRIKNASQLSQEFPACDGNSQSESQTSRDFGALGSRKCYFACSPVNIFFVFAWEFCIEKRRGLLVNFFWSLFPTKPSTKTPRKIRGTFGAELGQNSGRKFEKFGELSFCNFSDLKEMVGFSSFSFFFFSPHSKNPLESGKILYMLKNL